MDALSELTVDRYPDRHLGRDYFVDRHQRPSTPAAGTRDALAAWFKP